MSRRRYGGLVILLLLNLTFHLSLVSFLVCPLIRTVLRILRFVLLLLLKNQVGKTLVLFLKYIFLLIFLQRGRERDRVRNIDERVIDQLSLAHPLLGMCTQPRYTPLTGIELGTFQSAGQRSIH
uniref:Uncharacterized protein n=1 Tax=Pipistrellus kuhlii TaxID=59472 RepID=A0A7J8A827_PIPKU|nr:hypothetical protein mPipKuh1_009002 [Pipistrellus kuhlii]